MVPHGRLQYVQGGMPYSGLNISPMLLLPRSFSTTAPHNLFGWLRERRNQEKIYPGSRVGVFLLNRTASFGTPVQDSKFDGLGNEIGGENIIPEVRTWELTLSGRVDNLTPQVQV